MGVFSFLGILPGRPTINLPNGNKLIRYAVTIENTKPIINVSTTCTITLLLKGPTVSITNLFSK